MRSIILTLLLGVSAFSQANLESQVLGKIQKIYQEQGAPTFSSLYNSQAFNEEERAFVGRLYEIFFAVPGFLQSEYRSTGQIPTRSQMANSFGVGIPSIDLLLGVMEADRRVPPMFTREAGSREIVQLNLENISAFVSSKGSNVRITQWEGQLLPTFSLARLGGGRVSDSDLRGSSALIYFWFTGCPPCVRIAPILAELSREYEAKGIRFVGVNADELLGIDTTAEARLHYLSKNGLHFDNLVLDAETREKFGNVNVYPTLFVVGQDGRIQRHLVNFQSKETLLAALQLVQP